jgi:flagellar export protein FliJ
MAAILQYREQQKTKREQELGAAMQRAEEARARLAEARAQWDETARSVGEGARFTAASRQQAFTALQFQAAAMIPLQEAVLAADRGVQESRAQVTKARLDFELISRLEQKWRAGEQRAGLRRAQTQMDEIAIIRASRPAHEH